MPTRRSFVIGGLGVGAVLATQGAHNAAGQADRRLIVDAQVHLWKAESPDWKWVPGLQPQLPEPFTIERLVLMMDEAGLPKWKEQQGMLGVRVTFNNAQTIPWLTDGTANWFWAAAEKAGLPVMCFAPGRVALLGPIAEQHPQLTLILDHMGLTAAMVKDNKVEEAIGQTVALAKYPNVSVKVSASPGISREPYPFRDVTVHLKRVFDAYGPQRSYWGTDLTNSYAKASYRQRISHFTEELSFLSESDKDWVMGRAIVQRLNWT